MKIGIASQDECRKRTLSIAEGKYKPKSDEPKLWFTSIALAREALASGRMDFAVHASSSAEFVDLNNRPVIE
jgi:predicted transcriptional regulator